MKAELNKWMEITFKIFATIWNRINIPESESMKFREWYQK
jgi:hypothetical protein